MRVFDASAVLAAVFDEPGGSQAAAWMEAGDGIISSINYAEVMSKLLERGVSAADADNAWAGVPLQVEALTLQQARSAAAFRPQTRHLGLSLGDRCCLALARERGWPAVTAERAWAQLDGHHIALIR
jgi:PIN domain nuclease of toxin-antitoxin system